MKKQRKFTVMTITYASFFIGLSVVINTLRIGNLSFSGFPIIFSGYVLGPVMGFVVGLLADILAFIVRPAGFPFNPVFTFTSALTGMIPVLITTILGDDYPDYKFWKILIGVFIGQVITSVIMTPYLMSVIYGKYTFWYLMIQSAIKQAVSIPIYAVLIKIVWDRMKYIVHID
ncbi:folate family ECF transporter S component [Microaceticoccus formicicus]|uniref:folate family ECF transporter S component n=1 Tax=Microaceticoccus formicicus TaxID=3118105 RepID=UPI003CCFFB07|nr:folate family ECF transporter S component [Peptoniphilaceae bacterium AMB_02]